MTTVVAKPGLEGIIASDTDICCVDQGKLLYRGYTIADLAETATFEEVAHLLLFGDLPSPSQLDTFRDMLSEFHGLAPAVIDALRPIPKDVPMMDVLRTGVSLAGHFDPVKGESTDGNGSGSGRTTRKAVAFGGLKPRRNAHRSASAS